VDNPVAGSAGHLSTTDAAPARSTTLPYPTPTSPAATAAMRANRRADTGPERRLRSLLHASGYRFRKDYPIRIPGLRVRADIVFPRRRIAIFVDGCFWHGCPQHGSEPRSNTEYWLPKLHRNIQRDRRTDRLLHDGGWKVVRLWEHIAAEEAVEIIAGTLAVSSGGGESEAPELLALRKSEGQVRADPG
jgi:DNA mismatch endonuclease, patch repair protein